MARKNYSYARAENSKTGIMVCASCQKPITEGWYRYRRTEDRFINQHKSCCLDDPHWKAMEDKAQALERKAKSLKNSIDKLIKQHNIKEPEDLISWIEELYELDTYFGEWRM